MCVFPLEFLQYCYLKQSRYPNLSLIFSFFLLKEFCELESKCSRVLPVFCKRLSKGFKTEILACMGWMWEALDIYLLSNSLKSPSVLCLFITCLLLKESESASLEAHEVIILCVHREKRKIFHCSVAQSCLTLCDPMDCSMPGYSVLHCLPEFAQIHVHWADDAIWPPHPSPFAFNASSIRVFPVSRLFTSGGQRIGASAFASILPMNIQGWFPQRVLQGKDKAEIFLMRKETECWRQGLWWGRTFPASWQQELREELIDPCPKADRKDIEIPGRSAQEESCGYVSIQVWPQGQWHGLKGLTWVSEPRPGRMGSLV